MISRRRSLNAIPFAGLVLLSTPPSVRGQTSPVSLRVALVGMPYSGARNVPEISPVPRYLLDGGLEDTLRSEGVVLEPTRTVALSAADEKEYGTWHRMALANGHLGDMVAAYRRAGVLPVGLLANCTSVIGILGGLQHSGPDDAPLRVGLVYIDAHADFNVPETTLSGMLGGMPVAVAAGLALENLRTESGLDPPIPSENVVEVAVRDVDPLERKLLAASLVQNLSVDDLRHHLERVRSQMARISSLADVIYVHVDMDVLDPSEVPGHPLHVSGGPTSRELAAALTEMFRFPEVAALGIASTPAGEHDPTGVSRRAAYKLVEGALAGVRSRGASSSGEPAR
jgi:arginase